MKSSCRKQPHLSSPQGVPISNLKQCMTQFPKDIREIKSKEFGLWRSSHPFFTFFTSTVLQKRLAARIQRIRSPSMRSPRSPRSLRSLSPLAALAFFNGLDWLGPMGMSPGQIRYTIYHDVLWIMNELVMSSISKSSPYFMIYHKRMNIWSRMIYIFQMAQIPPEDEGTNEHEQCPIDID